MSFGETIVRWALIIGFGLLASVAGTAGLLLLTTKELNPNGNPVLLLSVAVVAGAIAFWLHRRLRALKANALQLNTRQ